jgi:hypothetical protein
MAQILAWRIAHGVAAATRNLPLFIADPAAIR